MSPERIVESYLNVALNVNTLSDRERLLQYTTGRLKDALTAASDEVFTQAYIKRHYDLMSYAVVQRNDRTSRETEITYKLVYKDLGVSESRPADASQAPTITTENTVALIKEKGAWFIRDVLGAKSTIDFPITQDSMITAKPGTP
jgi:hypothetical protein